MRRSASPWRSSLRPRPRRCRQRIRLTRSLARWSPPANRRTRVLRGGGDDLGSCSPLTHVVGIHGHGTAPTLRVGREVAMTASPAVPLGSWERLHHPANGVAASIPIPPAGVGAGRSRPRGAISVAVMPTEPCPVMVLTRGNGFHGQQGCWLSPWPAGGGSRPLPWRGVSWDRGAVSDAGGVDVPCAGPPWSGPCHMPPAAGSVAISLAVMSTEPSLGTVLLVGRRRHHG